MAQAPALPFSKLRLSMEYRQHFKDPLPVRTTVVARLLAPGALIEVTVTAAQRD